MSFNVADNFKRLINRGTSQGFDPNTARFEGARGGTISGDANVEGTVFGNILKGGELPETFRESVFSRNQVQLGKSLIDASNARQDLANTTQQSISNLASSTQEAFSQISSIIQSQAPSIPTNDNASTGGGSASTGGSSAISETINAISGAIATTGIPIGIIIGGVILFALLKR